MKKIILLFAVLFISFAGMAQETYKVYTEGNYIFIEAPNGTLYEGFSKEVLVRIEDVGSTIYYFSNINGWRDASPLNLAQITTSNGTAYTEATFRTFYTTETGKP